MRVAIFAETYLPYLSGVTVSTEALARGLGARGHDVLLVAPRPAGGAEPGSAGAGGPEPTYAWAPSYQLPGIVPPGYRMPWPPGPWARDLERRVAAFAPEIVHAQSPFVTGRMARRVAGRTDARLVFTHHTRFGDYRHYLGPLGAPGARLTDAYLRRFWGACDAIIAPSTDLAREIVAHIHGRPRPVVRPIPTGVDVAGIRMLSAVDPRPALDWPPDAVVAVTLGRLAREKGVDLLLAAFGLAAAFDPHLHLVFIGGGPAGARLQRRATHPDVAGRVAFTGPLPRQEALARAKGGDLFVFASHTETQGLVLAEALAAGLPVVTLEGPGVTDSVRDAQDGVVVRRQGTAGRDAEALAREIAAMASDGARRATLARAAAAAAGRFDVDRRLAEVERLYADVLVSR